MAADAEAKMEVLRSKSPSNASNLSNNQGYSP